MAIEGIEIIWLFKHKENVRSGRDSVSINSCTDSSKTIFPVTIVNHKFSELFNHSYANVKAVSWKCSAKKLFSKDFTKIAPALESYLLRVLPFNFFWNFSQQSFYRKPVRDHSFSFSAENYFLRLFRWI